MKTLNTSVSFLKKFCFAVLAVFGSAFAFAQDAAHTVTTNGGTTTTTSTTTEQWYANPLYLVIGAVLLIALLAMLLRGRNRD